MPIGRKLRRVGLAVLALLVVGVVGHRVALHFWAKHHYGLAATALERRDFPQARSHLEKCLSVWPGEPAVLLLAAQTARRMRDFDEAIRYQKLCKKKGLGEGLEREYALLELQEGDLAAADWYQTFCADHPDSAETPLILEAIIVGRLNVLFPLYAEKPAARGKAVPGLAELRQAVDQWLRLRPGDADQVQGLVWRGRALRVLGEHARAVGDFREALRRDPDHFEGRLVLALAVVQDAPEEAATCFEALRRRDPNNPTIRLALARVRRCLGQLEQARKLLEELQASRPDDVGCLLESGHLALDALQPYEAERLLRRALTLAPRMPEIHLALSRCLLQLGRAREAKQHQDLFLSLDAERKRHEAP